MTASELLRLIRRLARRQGLEVTVEQGKGSHRKVTVGGCFTVIPFHRGETVGAGLRRSIERDLEPCLGRRWTR